MYLLDTNVVSETSRSTRANPGVVAWLNAADIETLYLSAITDLELEIGVLSKERTDHVQGIRLRAWLERIRDLYQGRILPLTAEDARVSAALHVPDRRPFADSLIAGTALRRGLTIVSRNIRDFDSTGASVINPFS